jgi:hypothetical protein
LGVRTDQIGRYGIAALGALAVHALVLTALVWSISFQPPPLEVIEPRIVAISPAPPPPPDVSSALADIDAPMMVPRFRPREPLGMNPERRERFGDPALAIWKHLCNRDTALSEAAQRACPPLGYSADMSVRDPLNRQGDAGVMLGAETATMSLEEAGVKRGWIRPPAQRGQSGLAAKTDQVNQPAGPELFETLPTLKGPTEGAPDQQ